MEVEFNFSIFLDLRWKLMAPARVLYSLKGSQLHARKKNQSSYTKKKKIKVNWRGILIRVLITRPQWYVSIITETQVLSVDYRILPK